MGSFPPDAKFKYPWRTYQQRVLAALDGSLDDNRLHVVAAPGSGKTVLGIEVLLRLGKPALVLAPTLTIRDQWVERLTTLFLPASSESPSWLSRDLRRPGLLTVATYQAIHAAYTGREEVEEDDAADEEGNDPLDNGQCEETSDAPADGVGLILRQRGVGTIVVDECHHLRAEWWRTLSRLRGDLPEATIVALTATPPYDVSSFERERYTSLCGPIDVEVPVPELVLAKDLCPHQDYIWLSTPSEDESARLWAFRDGVERVMTTLSSEPAFVAAVAAHPWIADPESHIEQVLDDPEYFASLLVLLHSAGRRVPAAALRVLGVTDRRLPALDLQWFEVLLTGCLFRDAASFARARAALDSTERELRRIGAIERRQVMLRATPAIEKWLTYSASKLDSVVGIVGLENDVLGSDLRMVVLTDYIRAVDLPKSRDDIRSVTRLGVAPIFEKLRRADLPGVKLAALSGSLTIIPAAAREALVQAAGEAGVAADRLALTPLAHAKDYLRVAIVGEAPSSAVQLMTRLFSAGQITVLVGTKSLLGEGWDAPAMNALVLASFVGSYMLSNQMRGRAIRTQAAHPEKTADIWHLVCVEPESPTAGPDFETLARRFRAFVGVALDKSVIESGIERMGLPPSYSRPEVAATNMRMSARARDRRGLARAWQQALALGGAEAGTVEQLRAPVKRLTQGVVFANTVAALLWEALFVGGYYTTQAAKELSSVRARSEGEYLALVSLALLIGALAALPRLVRALLILVRHGTVEGSIAQVGQAVLQTLAQVGAFHTPISQLRVIARTAGEGAVYCALTGGDPSERNAYLRALCEVLDPVENPRYLLRRRSFLGLWHRTDYHAVPSAFGARKESAERFARAWRSYVGPAELVYCRTVEGRKVLLKARMEAMSSAFRAGSYRVSCWEYPPVCLSSRRTR